MDTTSHIGIRGNDIADNMANQATSLDESTSLIPNDVKSYIQRNLKAEWSSKWSLVTNNKLRENKNHTNPYTLPPTRREQVIITRVRIGHSKLTHKYLISGDEPPECLRCQTQLTIKHLLFECAKFNNLRRYLNLGQIVHIEDKTTPEIIKIIIKYITSTQLYNQL